MNNGIRRFVDSSAVIKTYLVWFLIHDVKQTIGILVLSFIGVLFFRACRWFQLEQAKKFNRFTAIIMM